MVKEVKNNKKDVKKKDTKKKVTKKNNEKFFASIKKELKLVKWPSFKDLVKYTIATLIFCLIFIVFFELLNIIMAYIKGLFN